MRASVCATTVSVWPFFARAQRPRVLGVVPYLPPRRLVALYAPLLPVLEEVLRTRLEIASAPDYDAHLSRLRSGAYDVVADGPIHARLAQRELRHVPVARSQAPLEPLLVVRADASVQRLSELPWGRMAIAVTDRAASLGVIGLRHLRDLGHVPGRDFRVVVSGTHANSLQRLVAGEVQAAIVSRTTLAQVDATLAAAARPLAPLGRGLSAIVYHVAPELREHAASVTQALLRFADQPAGRAFIATLGHQGLLPVTDAEMQALDPLVVELYRQSHEGA